MRIFILVFFLFGSATVFGQSNQLNGFVRNDSDQGIEGATIIFENSVSKTGVNGQFNLRIPSDQDVIVIRVTRIGYHSLETMISRNQTEPIVLFMRENTELLEEVTVNTGYQILPKERATGVFKQVDNELFSRQISTDVISRLDGLVPGVLFDNRRGENQNFQIRGISTLNSSTASPLIVLDNFPYEGDINNINPNDVESVTFLMDAAAASIWGARAGNGVVVITTKKASAMQPFKVNLRSNISIREKKDLFYLPRVSSSDFIDIEMFLFDKGVYNNNLNNTRSWPVVSPVVELLESMRKGNLSESMGNEMINSFRNLDIRDDYTRYLYRNAVDQQYSLDLSGSSDKVGYILSLGYDRNLHELRENQNERLSMRSLITARPIKNLELNTGITLNFNKAQNNNPGEVGTSENGRELYSYAQLVDRNGAPLSLEKIYRKKYIQSIDDPRLMDWQYYPLKEIYENDHITKRNGLLLNTSVKYSIIPGLNAEVLYQFEQQSSKLRDYKSQEIFSTRNLINKFIQKENSPVEYAVPVGGILNNSDNTMNAHSLRSQIDLSRPISENNNLSVLLGGEIRSRSNYNMQNTLYGFDDDIKTVGSVNYLQRYPVYNGLASDQNIPFNDRHSSSVNRFVSLYTNIANTYLDRYTLSFSARRDASNIFGATTNNKWKPLWSTGFMWNVANEPFFKTDKISALNLRATYGFSGNVNNGVSSLTTLRYDLAGTYLGQLKYAWIINPPNPELRWENVSQFNLNLFFALKNNRIQGDISFYEKNAKDLITAVDVDPTVGYSTVTKNSANIKTTGWDVNINGIISTRQVKWNTDLLVSKTKNVLTKYYFGGESISSGTTRGALIASGAGVGYPLNAAFSFRFAGLDPLTGDPLGYIDGEESTLYSSLVRPKSIDDMVFHGTALPNYYGAFRNTWIWKGISLSVNMAYQFDFYFRKSSVGYGFLGANAVAPHADFYKRWKEPGDEMHTNIPSMVYPNIANRDLFYLNSDATMEKGDNIRIKDLNLSYSLNGLRMNNSAFKSMRIMCYVNNIDWVLWKATDSGLDPLYGNNSPNGTSVSFGITANF